MRKEIDGNNDCISEHHGNDDADASDSGNRQSHVVACSKHTENTMYHGYVGITQEIPVTTTCLPNSDTIK